MTSQLIVVENKKKWSFPDAPCPVVDADDYLTNEEYFKLKNVQVINLCRSYKYLSVAYYSSLLAEARNHKVIPSVKTMLDLSSKAMYSLAAPYLDEAVQKGFKKITAHVTIKEFEISVFFGICHYPALAELTRQIFEMFPYPILRITFSHQKKWIISEIKPDSIDKLSEIEWPQFIDALNGYLKRRWRGPKNPKQYRFDMAILVNPEDPQPPSNKRALNALVRVGRTMGIDIDLIEKKDYARLAEYDALFIRDTTRINHYTYRFAKKAENEGMVVIDDPQSILRCTNKVYLAELLEANRIPAPKTAIVGKNDIPAAEQMLGYPLVLKMPDGSFSQGVFKVENSEQFHQIAQKLFKESELILAQEFLYTEFDWRIGVLNKKIIFACKYFMSRKHWQIVRYSESGRRYEGQYKTIAVEDVPKEVIKTALKATSLIGDGLYGVDIKQNEKGVYVIEVNDNPNIDGGVEDLIIKDKLYQIILGEFLRRLEKRHTQAEGKPNENGETVLKRA